jgi:hypothetical protein
MRKYSEFFKTLHDETVPTGYLGRGTHYSVFRAITFHNPVGDVLPEGKFWDFAVIWDEDHDERVIEPIESVYRHGFLASFLIFGERRGEFTAILADEVRERERHRFLAARLASITENVDGDVWSACVTTLGSADNSIISDASDKVDLYLTNLKMLWNLGLKSAVPGPKISNPYRYTASLRDFAGYLKHHSRMFVRTGPAMLTPEATARQQRRIEELATAIESLAYNDRATYERFEVIRGELQKLGMSATNELVGAVARSFAEAS